VKAWPSARKSGGLSSRTRSEGDRKGSQGRSVQAKRSTRSSPVPAIVWLEGRQGRSVQAKRSTRSSPVPATKGVAGNGKSGPVPAMMWSKGELRTQRASKAQHAVRSCPRKLFQPLKILCILRRNNTSAQCLFQFLACITGYFTASSGD